jgi:hypothetical protein
VGSAVSKSDDDGPRYRARRCWRDEYDRLWCRHDNRGWRY